MIEEVGLKNSGAFREPAGQAKIGFTRSGRRLDSIGGIVKRRFLELFESPIDLSLIKDAIPQCLVEIQDRSRIVELPCPILK